MYSLCLEDILESCKKRVILLGWHMMALVFSISSGNIPV